MKNLLFFLLIAFFVFSYQEFKTLDEPSKGVARKNLVALEDELKSLKRSVALATNEEEILKARTVLEEYLRVLLETPQSLFDKFTPGARTLCTVIFPTLTTTRIEDFVNYIIDKSNESLGFYFDKKPSDLGTIEINILIRELTIFIDFFAQKKELVKSPVYERLKAFKTDYLFFKSYLTLLKHDLRVIDPELDEVDFLMKEIKRLIQSLANSKYDQYYRKRLEMLDLVIQKVGEKA